MNLADMNYNDNMTKYDPLQNIIGSERQDNLEVLSRMENALEWDDLDSTLRETYVDDVPYRRLVVEHLTFLLECCETWQNSKPTPTVIECEDVSGDIDDGLEWIEEMLRSDIAAGLSGEQLTYAEFICRSSRHWRVTHL